MTELNPHQFGISKREEAEMTGHAIAEHLWEGFQQIMDPQGIGSVQRKMDAADALNTQFPGHSLKTDDEGDPYHEVRAGNWAGRYYGGPHLHIHHRVVEPHQAQDVIDMTDRDAKVVPFSHEQAQAEVHHWARTYGPDYEQNLRRSR